jgi:hypothetical protein
VKLSLQIGTTHELALALAQAGVCLAGPIQGCFRAIAQHNRVMNESDRSI